MKNPVKVVVFIAFLWAFFQNALKLARSEKPALIHAHWWLPAGIIGLVVSKILRRPLVISVHGTDLRLLNNLRFLRPIARRVFLHTESITTASSFLKQKLVRLLAIAEDKITIIPTPIQVPPVTRQPPKLKHQIITIARLSKQKRIVDLIQACHLLAAQAIDFNLLVVGDGGERTALQHLIVTLGLQTRIRLLGALPHNEIYDYLRQSELFVLPSIEEGFGVVLVEAMACRVPVIGADSGGIPDIILDGTTGRLFPVRDPAAIARTIIEAFKNKTATKKFVRAALTRFQNTFTVEKIARQMRSTYDHIITSKGGLYENT